MKRKDWMSMDKLKKLPKNQILIAGLAGVLLLVIAMPTGSSKKETEEAADTKQQETTESESGSSTYEKKMERRLTEVLEAMDGVGKVEVMITLKDSGESVVEKDTSTTSQKTAEGETGSTTQSDTQTQEETVFTEESGEQQPFISKEVTPQIEGILVVAEGGGNSVVVKNISDAVLALFPVEAHKIKVVKMNL